MTDHSQSKNDRPVARNEHPVSKNERPKSEDSGSDGDRSPEKPPQKPDQQPPPPGTSPRQLLFILLAIIGAVLILNAFASGFQCELSLSDFLKLVDHGPRPEVFVEVEEGPKNGRRTVRYSNLKKLRVNDYIISGTVTREVTAPEKYKKAPEENVRFFVGRQGFTHDNGILLTRLEENGFKFDAEGYPSMFRHMFAPSLLMFLLMIPLLFLFFRFIGNSGAMAFSRSRGRQVAPEDIDVTFSDVAGVDEAVDELKETVAFLKTPERFQALGGRIPRGVLLVGPPGTGKTILAKAVAGEANVPFFSLSGSDFVELYVGVGAARVRDLFEQAQRCGRAIIFIDELDAIGKIRSGHTGGGSSEEREQTLNALLVEMDGFKTNSTTIVLAATNRPETLDPALLRPGRFDRQVLVDRPDLRGREEILKVHIKNVKLSPEIDLKEIASISVGFVGADLAALVNEAALLAARAGKDSVTMEEFTEGVERITAGLQKKQRIIRPEEKKRVAYHESGHALVAYYTPGTDPVHKVSIIPRGLAALGYTLQRPEDDRYLMTQTELEGRIKVLLGGTIAEELTFGNFSTGAQNDLERATEIARSMVMDFGMSKLGRINYREDRRTMLAEGIFATRNHSEKTAWEIDQALREIMQRLFDESKTLLEEKRDDLNALTERLLEKEVIENEELIEVLDPERAKREREQREREEAEKEAKEAIVNSDGSEDLVPDELGDPDGEATE